MQKQCTNGYKGRLCAICANDDGVMRASNSDFECNTCYTRHTSIVITILSFVANVATVLFTIIVTFMTDYTEDENMGIGDLFKVFIVHMQFFIIVTRININWPTSISFITSLMSACTGVVARVYAPSCMLDASATPEDVAAITQLVAIISPLLTILVVAVLWMIIRVIVFNLDNATRTEQKLDMRTINEYKTDRVRRLMEKRQDDGDDGLATGTSSDSPYCLYGHGYDAYMDLRAVDLLPAASYGQVEAGGTITTNTQQTNEAGTPLGIPPPPPPALNPCEVGRTYGGQGGAGLSYVHTGLPIQEGSVVEEMERSSSGAAFREGDEQHGDQQQQKWHLSLAHMEQKPSSVGSREEAKLPDKASWRSPSTQNRATEMAATVLPEEEAEKEHDSPNDAFYFPGAGNSRRPLLPLPPRPNEMPAAATSKKGLPPPSPPPAPLPSPPAPSPPQLSDAKVQADDGNETDGSGSVRHVRPASTPNVDGNPGSDPGSYIRSQSVPQVVAVAAGVPCPNDAGTTKSTQRSVVTSRTPSRSPLSLTTRASLEPLAQVPATSSPAAPPRSTGEGISINAGGGTSPQRGFESRSSQLSEVITNNATGSAEGSSAQVPAPLKGKSNSGRSKYKNLAVRLVGLDSFREMDTAVHTGTTGSDRAATGGGMNQAERGREGGRAAVIGPNGSQSPSEYLRRKLTEGSTWVRSFFTYDEEAAPLDGQVRWASLANIHRTMAWWRQELLIVMIACFVLYPAWAQATLQIFACYYLDDGTGFYPEHQLAQWGKGYWILNMNQECYLGQHARVWVPIGIVCIFIICAGIPLLTFMATWTHRTALGTVHVVQTYGFLYRRYNHENFYWWESAMQVQTLLLVVVDVFGRILAVYQQAVLLMLVLMLVMWANMFFQPLKHKVLERMSNLSLAILSFTVALGLFFIPPVERKDPVTSAAATAIGAIIVILNAGLLLYFIFVIWIHGREAINRKVEAAKQRVVTVGAKVHTGTQKVLRAIRHRVSSGTAIIRQQMDLSSLIHIRTYAHTHIHTCTCIHTHRRTDAQTHRCTYTQTSNWFPPQMYIPLSLLPPSSIHFALFVYVFNKFLLLYPFPYSSPVLHKTT
ncbi:hypothetical protein Vafri_19092 [Volvox africanus]|uniref:TRP C-terminal domain-containing protein n=1 Tax=Volvox africanus TaxID=51714 RepID=A0A8J4FBR5_9CHLO|nr:hypothetical protein Vafri_19092 [Volvox africanus]